jgi:hypothetical protein
MEDVAESPDVSAPEDTGGGEEPSTDLSADYIRDTISGATDKIPAAKYLHEQEEADKKQEKKQPKQAKGSQQPAAQQHEETAEEEAPSEDEQESEEAKSKPNGISPHRTRENPKLRRRLPKQQVQRWAIPARPLTCVSNSASPRNASNSCGRWGGNVSGYQWKQHIVGP